MSPMPKAQEYRSRAEECIRQAEGCSTETDKNHWLTMAEEWLRMAQQEVQLTGRPSSTREIALIGTLHEMCLDEERSRGNQVPDVFGP